MTPGDREGVKSPSFSVACDLNSKFDKGLSKYQEVVVVEIDENSAHDSQEDSDYEAKITQPIVAELNAPKGKPVSARA